MTATTASLPAAGGAPHDFLPPQTRGFGRSLAMALLVHALLVGALTWGIAWKRDPQTPVIAAELWSAVPVTAAPKEQEAPPPPPPPPPPEPARRAEPPPPTEADIALERARKQEQERKAREEAQRKAEMKKAEQKKADDKKAAERKEQERREQERMLADDKKRKDDERKVAERKREADAQKQREALRDEQLRRMQGLAGATGGEQSTGSAQRSAGPSASYAGRIVARVKPNIVFTHTVSGNPEAEVEVRAAPDGTIVGKRVVKSSGVKAWDEAVLRALDRTEVLPRDVDGRIPSTMILVFRPRD